MFNVITTGGRKEERKKGMNEQNCDNHNINLCNSKHVVKRSYAILRTVGPVGQFPFQMNKK